MRAIATLSALFAFAAFALGCSGPTYTCRYKLTLEVEVDGAIKRGFSIVEATEYDVRWPEGGVRGGRTGESLYIDLGSGRRPLVTLLTERVGSAIFPYRAKSILEKLYGGTYEWVGRRNDGLAALIKNRGAKTITIGQLPELVTFADIGDPSTVMTIDPNDLTATLGPGVKWHSMTIEFTDQPVTTGLETKLPWVAKMDSTMLDGDPLHRYGSSATLANSLSTADFLRKGY